MKVNYTIKREDNPCSVSHFIFGNVQTLLTGIRNGRKAVFSIERHTATSLEITISAPQPDNENCFAVAYVPKGAEGLKYLVSRQHNFFSGKTEERSYLKLTKAQRLPELKQYITAVLENLFTDMEEIDAELIIWGIPELED